MKFFTAAVTFCGRRKARPSFDFVQIATTCAHHHVPGMAHRLCQEIAREEIDISAAAGTHIVYLDFSHQVDIQVASADTFVVHNASSGTRTGNVTVIW